MASWSGESNALNIYSLCNIIFVFTLNVQDKVDFSFLVDFKQKISISFGLPFAAEF